MKKANKSIDEIMDATGACVSSVYTIWHCYKAGGAASLAPKKRGNKFGQRQHLSQAQEKLIQSYIIDKCPEHYKMDFALWTCQAVRQLITQKYDD